MKKHFITGFICGALLFGAAGVFAGQYVATENPFPIKLNGSDVSVEGYNIEGSTYFKLRDISDVIGTFDVDFKDDTILLTKDTQADTAIPANTPAPSKPVNTGGADNKYDTHTYINVSGRTIQEVAEASGMTLEQLLEQYNLPSDIPGDTPEAEVYNSISLEAMALDYGMSVDDLKSNLGLGDDVTADTPWGQAVDKSALKYYVGEENLAEFKEHYGFGDDVTGDTLWGEIRKAVETQDLQERMASEN